MDTESASEKVHKAPFLLIWRTDILVKTNINLHTERDMNNKDK